MIMFMKTTFALFTALILASAALAAEVGKPAPDFSATDINGKTVKLSDYKGKIVVLESYNSGCPFCNNNTRPARCRSWKKTWRQGGRVAHRQFRQPQQPQPPHTRPGQKGNRDKNHATAWIDDSAGAVGHLYDMKTTPDMCVIDKNGVLVYQGAIDNNRIRSMTRAPRALRQRSRG